MKISLNDKKNKKARRIWSDDEDSEIEEEEKSEHSRDRDYVEEDSSDEDEDPLRKLYRKQIEARN